MTASQDDGAQGPVVAAATSPSAQVPAASASAPKPQVAIGARKANPPANKPAAAATTAAQAPEGQSALLALLKIEAQARDARSTRDLIFLIANETRRLTRARQIFVLRPGLTGRLEVQGISSLPNVDRNAPLVRVIEDAVVRAAAIERPGTAGGGSALAEACTLDLATLSDPADTDRYPFRALQWVPLRHADHPPLGGLLLAREDAWRERDVVVAKRLAEAFAHAIGALEGKSRRQAPSLSNLQMAGAVAALLALLVFINVPLTALAPVEIVARDPFVVAAPIDGVIETIDVAPNGLVKSGDVLVKLADTTLRNRFDVAARDVQVSEARLKQANQIAFNDRAGMHDIGIARAELELKLAERDFARDMLDKTRIVAQRDGMALYSDKRELVGRPVAVGERILEIADPALVEARIALPVADAIALTEGAKVKLFLDSDPLRPWPATVSRADYRAKIGESDVVSFRVMAAIESSPDRAPPRLGVRGTAQILGDDVPLWLYLFRRPLTMLRQWIGV